MHGGIEARIAGLWDKLLAIHDYSQRKHHRSVLRCRTLKGTDWPTGDGRVWNVKYIKLPFKSV
jgi:hypothetical protein